MKTAIYIEGDVTQVVLTPETPLEKMILNSMKEGELSATVKQSQFHERRDGYYRPSSDENDNSLMIRLYEREFAVPA